MTRGRILRCAVLAAQVACEHGAPFTTPPTGSTDPLLAGPPVRLTYDPSADLGAAWLPDESGLVYSGVRADRDAVRCLMVLPPSGGRVRRSWCPGRLDVFNEYVAAALAPDGRLAFVRISRLVGASFPNLTEVATAPPESVTTPTTLRSVPFTIAGQPTFNDVSHLRWRGNGELIYRAGFEGYVCMVNVVCGVATRIRVRTGLGLVLQPLDPAAGGPALIPGTALASSVAVAADGDAIYYTLTGDSRVYRRVMSTGAVTVVANVTGSIVRDVQVAGNRLVVVAGGMAFAFVAQGGIGLVQVDSGGDLFAVNLATGAPTLLASGSLYAHPALSPSGQRLVAEANGDLWLFDLP